MSDEVVGRLEPALRAILELELARENEVVAVGHSDNPRAHEVIVCLKFSFGRRTDEFEGMRFRRITSPDDGWKDEYSVDEGRQILACLGGKHA